MKHKTLEFLLCFRAWGRMETQRSLKSLKHQFLGSSKRQPKPNDAHKHFPACPATQAWQVKSSQANAVGEAKPSLHPLAWHSAFSATLGLPAAKQDLQHLTKVTWKHANHEEPHQTGS